MKLIKILIITFVLISIATYSQDTTWSSKWSVDYVTSDSPDSLNSTGYNTISVAVVDVDAFVALVNRGSANAHYLVGYRDANKITGRLGNYNYQEVDKQMKWIDFFDQELVYDANDIAAKGNLVYITNNDEVNHSILVFELREDSIYTYPQRYRVEEYIWGIDIDGNGRIYVTKTGDSVNAGSVMILENSDTEPAWTTTGNTKTILQEFQLPDVGEPRGITVNESGTLLYVSNYDENKVYCYIGDPETGYELYEGFNFSVDGEFQASTELYNVGPYGLQLMPDKNLLFITHDADFKSGEGYEYGRIYIADPNTGEVLDTINTAEWNNYIEGQYDNHNPQNNASGYTSNYAVDFDPEYNVYTQSWFGWTVDKWIYDGELPTVEIIITGIEKNSELIPDEVSLSQNYPNPFNPNTTIEFSLNRKDRVSLKIFSITGELVANLINNADLSAGNYKVTFDAQHLASGTYIYKLTSGTSSITKKMTLLK
jgi:hypothetical protein